MTAPTHKRYSITFAILTTVLFYEIGINNINYYLLLILILLISKCGALFPDLDHNWENVKEKNIINRIINVIIHVTGGKHRSWQTHSWDICIISLIIALNISDVLYKSEILTEVNKEIFNIIIVGFYIGWISHLFSDMLTGEGVRIFCWYKKKIAFVPKKILGFKFNTGDKWEQFNYNLLGMINTLLILLAITYPIMRYIITS